MSAVLGSLEGIYITDIAGAEMLPQQEIRAVAGVGLEGDRYSTGAGHYSSIWHEDRQATFIALEVLEQLSAEHDWSFTAQESRRNFATRGLEPKDLIGVTFRIGEAVFYGGRENVPCKYLERLVGKPVFEPLVGRSGLNAQILRSGTVKMGQPIVLVEGNYDA